MICVGGIPAFPEHVPATAIIAIGYLIGDRGVFYTGHRGKDVSYAFHMFDTFQAKVAGHTGREDVLFIITKLVAEKEADLL